MTDTPRDKFIQLMIDNVKANGLDETTSRIVAILFLETGDVSLEELSKKTGYSLSSTSTSIKFMENSGLIHKYRKPHSKKIYLKMENDIIQVMLNMLRKKQEYVIKRSRDALPNIISEYKKSKSSKQELSIIERYYKDILISEGIISEMIQKIESLK